MSLGAHCAKADGRIVTDEDKLAVYIKIVRLLLEVSTRTRSLLLAIEPSSQPLVEELTYSAANQAMRRRTFRGRSL